MRRTRGLRDPPSATTAIAARALLTTKDVATLLRVHPKHVYRLMKRDLPALRVGNEWRFNREDVLRWAAGAGGAGPLGGQPNVAAPPGLVARTRGSSLCVTPPKAAGSGDSFGGAQGTRRRRRGACAPGERWRRPSTEARVRLLLPKVTYWIAGSRTHVPYGGGCEPYASERLRPFSCSRS